MLRFSIRSGFLLLAVLALASFGTFTAMSAWVVQQVKVTGPLYTNIVLGKDLVADILPPPAYVIESYLVCLQMLGERDPAVLQTLTERGKVLRTGPGGYDERHQYWVGQLPPGPMRVAMLETAHQPAEEFFRLRDQRFVPAILAGRHDEAQALAFGDLKAAYERHRIAIDQVVVFANAFNADNESQAALILKRGWWSIGGTAVALVGTAIIILTLLGRRILGAVRRSTNALSTLVTGTVTKLEPSGMRDFDVLTEAVNRTMATLRQTQERQQADAASAEAAIATRLSTVLGSARSASDIMRTTSASTAAAAGQISLTVESLATATTELTTSVRSIAEHTGEATRVTNEAAVMTGQIDVAMNGLTDSNQRIGEVIAAIQGIAAQTNLLALNATIEAASAGEAGRGFAVVANEVKNLARQTAAATEEITKSVNATQRDAQAVMALVQRVTQIIARTHTLQQQVDHDVEEQLTTTGEVARNVTQAAAGSNEIAKRISELAKLAEELQSVVR